MNPSTFGVLLLVSLLCFAELKFKRREIRARKNGHAVRARKA